MRMTQKARRILNRTLVILLIPLVVMTIYSASIPQRHTLQPGDVSPFDLTAPRSIRDKQETDLRAAKAAAEVPDVMLRSEQIIQEVNERVELFLAIIGEVRSEPPLPSPTPVPTPVLTDPDEQDETAETDPAPEPEPEPEPAANPVLTAAEIIRQLDQQLNIIISQDDALAYVLMTEDRFLSVQGHVRSLTSLIMAENIDQSGLRNSLANKIDALEDSMAFFREDASLIERSLALLLRPNVVFDSVATENARRAAYDSVQNNPVMIEKGSRIVSLGEVITDETYLLLKELSMIDDGSFDYVHLAGIFILLFILVAIAVSFMRNYDRDLFHGSSEYAALILSILIPFFVAAYIGRQAPLAPPVYFAAVLIAVYFSFRFAVIISFLLTAAILPMTNFNPVFLLVAISGSLVAALFTKGIIRKDNYAFIILATATTNFAVVLTYGLLQKENWTVITINSALASFSGALSVIAAIGIMPLFEMLFNTVSPLRLIELSQPGNPLLRRLFVEAPGTSQHSMMVANLADTAAIAIGANPLLARVGAYYHDIGKLENPHMFIENQDGDNPHDSMMPDQSARVILSHPEIGLRIGRRYRLPPAILRMIHEHHGSTAQAYFYHKAKEMAEEGKMEEPDLDKYHYHCPLPSTRESAILMLADSLEAAMKSANVTSLAGTEKLLRKIIKTKTDQDQLNQSDLSFRDLELIVQAFLQVYAGHFHERIAYPDDRPVHEPTN